MKSFEVGLAALRTVFRILVLCAKITAIYFEKYAASTGHRHLFQATDRRQAYIRIVPVVEDELHDKSVTSWHLNEEITSDELHSLLEHG
jgi:hypothetical protein